MGNWLNKARKDGGVGTHIVADLLGASRLDDPHHAEAVLRDCADAAGASLLYIYVHRFGGGGGVSGVAVLAESHISVHSWPEYHFAAVDMFMCGAAEPSKALPVLQAGFEPERIVAHELVRGRGALRPTTRSVGPEQGRPTEDDVKTSAALTSLFLCENDPKADHDLS